MKEEHVNMHVYKHRDDHLRGVLNAGKVFFFFVHYSIFVLYLSPSLPAAFISPT